MASSQGHNLERLYSIQPIDKFTSILGLSITSAVGGTLLALHIRQWRSSEAFALYVRTNPAQVAIVVQIVSHLLGLIQVQALCALLRCTFISSINTRPFSPNVLQWIQAASTPKMSFSSPWLSSLSLLVPVILSLVPAALWSGSIAPVMSVKTTTMTIPISTFMSQNASTLFNTPSNMLSGQLINDKGFFSFDPLGLKGSMQDAAAYASTANTSESPHPKLDKTAYQYQGRSYGTGAAVGLLATPLESSLWYQYEELTFASKATCAHNLSTNFTVETISSDGSGEPLVFKADGYGPMGEEMKGHMFSSWLPEDYFGWGMSTRPTANFSGYVYMRTFASPGHDAYDFADFNATQCRIDFSPSIFTVVVNNTNRGILAQPKSSNLTGRPQWPDYTDVVLTSALDWLWRFSAADTGWWGSTLGRTLRVNVNQLIQRTGHYDNDTVLRATEDFIESIIDNTLVALASSRTMMWNSTITTEAVIGSSAITFGSHLYIIATFALNLVICIVYGVEAVRTCFWQEMSRFDVMDLSATILGSFEGGAMIADDSRPAQSSLLSRKSRSGDMQLKLYIKDGGDGSPILVPVETWRDTSPAVALSILPSQLRRSYIRADSNGNFG